MKKVALMLFLILIALSCREAPTVTRSMALTNALGDGWTCESVSKDNDDMLECIARGTVYRCIVHGRDSSNALGCIDGKLPDATAACAPLAAPAPAER